jgi:hypothetical protein
MVEIDDLIRCPKYGNYGRVVWISKDGQTAGVRCSSRHRFSPRNPVISTPATREHARFEKNIVFLVDIHE